MLMYVNTEDSQDIWVRPLGMFLEKVTKDGKTFNRFEWINE
jgi:hypothetical protein